MLEDQDWKVLDATYLRKDDYNDSQSEVNSKINSDSERLALIEQQQKVNNWLTITILAGIIALVVKTYLGG